MGDSAFVGLRRDELGEFLRGDEPEFQGPIQHAVAGDADLWDSALDGRPEPLVVLGRGSEFNRQEGLSEACRQAPGDGEGAGQVGKVIVVIGIRLWQHEAGVFEIHVEWMEQSGQAAVTNLPENGCLGEEIKDPGGVHI